MNDYMTRRRDMRFAFAMLALSSVGVRCAGADPDEELRPVKPARLEDFVKLKPDMARAEVDKLLVTKGQHEFTYLDANGDTFESRLYEVLPAGFEFEAPLDVTFRNDRLFSVVHYDDANDHFQKLPASTSPTEATSFDEDGYITEFLTIESCLTGDVDSARELSERIIKQAQHYDEVMKRHRPNRPPAILGAVLNNPGYRKRLAEQYKLNAEERAQYDPAKIRIGMTQQEVNQEFGVPRYTEDLDGARVCLYGPEKLRGVNPGYVTSPVMVMFRDDSVVRTLSHIYFATAWKRKMWPPK